MCKSKYPIVSQVTLRASRTSLKSATDISPDLMAGCLGAFIDGLTDYTTDERGDVGSWIRISCVLGLSTFAQIIFTHSKSLSNFVGYFPPEKYHAAVGGILKQGVERLDNVRQQTGVQFANLLRSPLPEVDGKDRWRIFGSEILNELFQRRVRSPVRRHTTRNPAIIAARLENGTMQRGYTRKPSVFSRYRNIATRF